MVLRASSLPSYSVEVVEGCIVLPLLHELCILIRASEPKIRSEKNSLNIKFLGGIFLGHPGYPRQKLYASGLFVLF